MSFTALPLGLVHYRPCFRLTPCLLATDWSAKTRPPAGLPCRKLRLPACVSLFEGGIILSLPVRFLGISCSISGKPNRPADPQFTTEGCLAVECTYGPADLWTTPPLSKSAPRTTTSAPPSSVRKQTSTSASRPTSTASKRTQCRSTHPQPQPTPSTTSPRTNPASRPRQREPSSSKLQLQQAQTTSLQRPHLNRHKEVPARNSRQDLNGVGQHALAVGDLH